MCAVGCVAFAFILSDEAFGSLPASMYAAGEFNYEDVKVGDILRVHSDSLVVRYLLSHNIPSDNHISIMLFCQQLENGI